MPPADSSDVQLALRLGWLIAEVRGRARPHGPASPSQEMARGHWTLPLASERSVGEREVEREDALQSVARQANVDPVIPPGISKLLPAANVGTALGGTAAHYSDGMRSLGKLVSTMRPKGEEPPTAEFEANWLAFARLLYHWDAEIQDSLIARSDHLANAYELGRALAETY